MANKNPISLPVNCFHWPFVATATLNLSASGSLAITNLYPDSLAVFIAKSSAPFSSGLGKLTDGNAGSGSACSVTAFH